MTTAQVLQGDALAVLRTLPSESVNCCVTSPPYWGGQRVYGVPTSWPDGWFGELGHEPTYQQYIAHLVMVFDEVRRVLRTDGTFWLNLGDKFAGSKNGSNDYRPDGSSISRRTEAIQRAKPVKVEDVADQEKIGIPWMTVFALRAAGWRFRTDVVWDKMAGVESVRDRPTQGHEYLFMFFKQRPYHYDLEAASVPVAASTLARMAQNIAAQAGSERMNGGAKTNGPMRAVGNGKTRNRRTVWSIRPKGFKGAHFATFPKELVRPCLLAGCPKDGWALDPFGGSGTVLEVARELGMNAVSIDLNPAYCAMQRERLGLAA